MPPSHRRDWLRSTGCGCGFGALALAGLAHQQAAADAPASDPLAPRPGHHPAKAKRVIFLFMQGGVSHVDSFDHKPLLTERNGQSHGFDDARTVANTGKRGTEQRIYAPLWKFAPRGESGRWTSELFPEISKHVDKLCFLHGMRTEGVAHGPATLFLHTGSTSMIRPSLGSWLLYGLGTENRNLPGFVSIAPSAGNGGARNYGPAFLPALYQGTPLGKAGAAATTFTNLTSDRSAGDLARQQALIRDLHAAERSARPGDAELDALAESFELAWRMQAHAPDALDLTKESKPTLERYGIGAKATDTFGRQCLQARRLAERDVRFIQVTYGDNTANPAWDQHSNLPKHADHAKAVDQPIAALLADLAEKGLLEETLVWWGGEFGRTPYAEKNGTGRDHNPGGFTVWLAGGGTKPGFAHGATDEWGFRAVEGVTHMHDLHATVLHLLGLDHEQLTYRYAGRNFRLTDVHGHVVREIIA